MATIKTLKKKVKVTQGTYKITTAMKLVSAAKLNKSQTILENIEEYVNELDELVHIISALNENYEHPLLQSSHHNCALLIVISSDRGLCGNYNMQLAKKVHQFIQETQKDVKVSFFGKKCYELLRKKVNCGKLYEYEKNMDIQQISDKIGTEVLNEYISGEIGYVYLAFNDRVGSASYKSVVKGVLPFEFDKNIQYRLKQKWPHDFVYEPDKDYIFEKILPEAYKGIFYKNFVSAKTTEYAARMVAMDNAAKNCEEAIGKLNLKINKLRQALITNELIEIVSGTESLQ
ncbi:MAG: ATP synthase F1 subunit gamma [Bacteriovoracaceae bacterium]|nr:ATP synthase F1 subunit gamma [Bacteriovoracaceae bacterium]